MQQPQIVSRDEWLAARKQLLTKEKELTRLHDQLSAERRALPWVKVEKPYVFDGPRSKETLADLFDGRSQLIVKHFMFGPDWPEGCVGCSFESDHVGGALAHLEHHDVTYIAVSRAPFPKIEAFRRRMGWRFKWISSLGNDFNYDFHVSFTPEQRATGEMYYNYDHRPFLSEEMSGRSVFYKNAAGEVFHTYSSFGRGGEMHLGTYHYLDITPKGREETVNGNMTDWVRHHDKYGDGGFVDSTGRYVAPEDVDACCHTGT
jgi:predicted dithiol-disulfide oxidoreductase (DUF899 family)